MGLAEDDADADAVGRTLATGFEDSTGLVDTPASGGVARTSERAGSVVALVATETTLAVLALATGVSRFFSAVTPTPSTTSNATAAPTLSPTFDDCIGSGPTGGGAICMVPERTMGDGVVAWGFVLAGRFCVPDCRKKPPELCT